MAPRASECGDDADTVRMCFKTTFSYFQSHLLPSRPPIKTVNTLLMIRARIKLPRGPPTSATLPVVTQSLIILGRSPHSGWIAGVSVG